LHAVVSGDVFIVKFPDDISVNSSDLDCGQIQCELSAFGVVRYQIECEDNDCGKEVSVVIGGVRNPMTA
jgi:hypothetical protein